MLELKVKAKKSAIFGNFGAFCPIFDSFCPRGQIKIVYQKLENFIFYPGRKQNFMQSFRKFQWIFAEKNPDEPTEGYEHKSLSDKLRD